MKHSEFNQLVETEVDRLLDKLDEMNENYKMLNPEFAKIQPLWTREKTREKLVEEFNRLVSKRCLVEPD